MATLSQSALLCGRDCVLSILSEFVELTPPRYSGPIATRSGNGGVMPRFKQSDFTQKGVKSS